MIQPEELKRDDRLIWSTGKGTDVWAMFQAATSGDLPAIQKLLAKDPSLVRGAWNYRKPMYFAVRENRIDVARYLLDHGADPMNAWGDDTLPQIARDRGYAEMLQLLETTLASKWRVSPEVEPITQALKARDLPRAVAAMDAAPGHISSADRSGNQPIHWAVMTRNLEAIDEVLKRGADINAKRNDGARPVQLANGDYNFRGWRDVPKDVTATPLDVFKHLRSRGAYIDICTAAAVGDLDRVRELVREDRSLANTTSDYVTYYLASGSPLKNAAARGHMEIVEFLLKNGADPNLPEEGIAPYGNALYSAVYGGHHAIARLLLEHHAYPSPPVESSADALSIALMNKDQEMVDLLCTYGSSRPLHILAYYGDVQTAAAMFAAKPDLANDPDALHNAAGEGQESFVRLMLKYYPDLPQRLWGGAKTRALTELLFEHGLNPNQPNWMMATPLHHFARSNDIEKAQLFLDRGANIHARDEELSSTPLGWAAKFGKLEMVEFLLGHGAKANHPDDPEWATPLAWATRRGHTTVAELLTKR
jgi:ankyrin repeat protein